jgi:A/G-specific adenine glycosylase
MELGAIVCFPRDPVCARCPAARRCAARVSGAPDRYPEAAPPLKVRSERRVLLVSRRAGRVLLVPDPAERGATWTLPSATVPAKAGTPATAAATASAARALARRLGHAGDVRGPIARFRHRTFSHDLAFEVWESSAPAPTSLADSSEKTPPNEERWAAGRDLDRLPLRAPTLKALNKLRS